MLHFHCQVMVAEALDITRETYLAILMDREKMGPVIVGSPEGGVDIEEVAEKTPELIFTVRSFAFLKGGVTLLSLGGKGVVE